MEGMQEASLAEEMRHVTRKGKTGSLHRCWHASHNAAVGSRGSTTISKSLRTAIPKELLGSVRRELRALVRSMYIDIISMHTEYMLCTSRVPSKQGKHTPNLLAPAAAPRDRRRDAWTVTPHVT
ncbi:predicted protein [Coccidioides posadasii str. Silveira]|uniref:Predicted protein n=1 Tax=Coccidioides posadasii (strain RMSCC 757 / Silveira) TaxID=443226 RepID=E9D421_COCPS|nr:predicted protein [Coccidioides posadasii str. Silveira]